MNINSPSQTDWYVLVINIILTLVFLYQAWVNFSKGKISRFSMDGISLFFATTFFGSKVRQRALALSRDPKRVLFFGIFAILGVSGGIYEISIWFSKFR
jgi:hypothetical protein